MKIGTAGSPDAGRTEMPARAPRRARAATAGREDAKSPTPAADGLELSARASSIRSAQEAARVAGETRELIAANNREALLAQPVDVARLTALWKRA
jgi:hypothetical protein